MPVGDDRETLAARDNPLAMSGIEFVPVPEADPVPPAVAGNAYFGVVQYVDEGRDDEWIVYYGRLFDFSLLPDDERFGILPRGTPMRSACGGFLWQLVAPIP